MSLSDGMPTMTMPVAPANTSGSGNGFGWGGDGAWWIIILFCLFLRLGRQRLGQQRRQWRRRGRRLCADL